MKSNPFTSKYTRRLSSGQIPLSGVPLSDFLPSKIKFQNYLKKTDEDDVKNCLTHRLAQSKKHTGEKTLKGLLSPIDSKIIELSKQACASKVIAEGVKASYNEPKKRASHFSINHNESQHVFDVPKKKSVDDKKKLGFDQPKLENKSVFGNKHIPSNKDKMYMHDVQYVVNPMFSPINGPAKIHNREASLQSGDVMPPRYVNSCKHYDENLSAMPKEKHSSGGKTFSKAALIAFLDSKKLKFSPNRDGNTTEDETKTFRKIKKDLIHAHENEKTKRKRPQLISPRFSLIQNISPAQLTDNINTLKRSLHSTQNPMHSTHSQERDALKMSTKASSPKKSKINSLMKNPKKLELSSQSKSILSDFTATTDAASNSTRPRMSKLSERGTLKDINSPFFSAFQRYVKRNSAGHLGDFPYVIDSNVQSTRSALEHSGKQHCSKLSPSDEQTWEEKIGEDLSKKVDQNMKVLNLKKQVKQKRMARDFKSVDQNIFKKQTEPLSKNAEGVFKKPSTKKVDVALQDHTNSGQLNDICFRVKRILDLYKKKELAWQDEKRELINEIQSLKFGKGWNKGRKYI